MKFFLYSSFILLQVFSSLPLLASRSGHYGSVVSDDFDPHAYHIKWEEKREREKEERRKQARELFGQYASKAVEKDYEEGKWVPHSSIAPLLYTVMEYKPKREEMKYYTERQKKLRFSRLQESPRRAKVLVELLSTVTRCDVSAGDSASLNSDEISRIKKKGRSDERQAKKNQDFLERIRRETFLVEEAFKKLSSLLNAEAIEALKKLAILCGKAPRSTYLTEEELGLPEHRRPARIYPFTMKELRERETERNPHKKPGLDLIAAYLDFLKVYTPQEEAIGEGGGSSQSIERDSESAGSK